VTLSAAPVLRRTIPPAGRVLWEDDFDGPAGSAPDPAVWKYHVGRYGNDVTNSEIQYYTAARSNSYITGDGCLAIVVRQEDPPDHAAAPTNFTSARLNSKGNVSWCPAPGRPIRITTRIKTEWEPGCGLVPAFWTVGDPDNWPDAGEIDWLELPSHLGPFFAAQTLHMAQQGSPGTHKQLSMAGVRVVTPLNTDFHVIGADWYVDRFVTHVDGLVTGVARDVDVAAVNGNWTPFSGVWAHYFLLNVAVGNAWTGDPSAGVSWPKTTLYDYVRVEAL
jgi:beta-glucanase (GH16 family)